MFKHGEQSVVKETLLSQHLVDKPLKVATDYCLYISNSVLLNSI